MYITIILLPFLGAILSGLFGRALGVKGVHIINVSCLLITTLLALIAYYEVVLCNSPVSIDLFSWINAEHLQISWGFYFDQLTVNMLIPVLIVSLLVHVYSIGYMGEDPHQQRFFSYISLFTGLMLVLVTGNNFLVMFLGWEGVGVCSYLLVHFWYTRVAAVKSALNAMFTNRVGDYFLTLGFFGIFYTFGTLDYATVFSIAPYINTNVITFISILLLLGAAAKSAQIGLHQWLPMAMEGPTPVSSLIHAATMVTAGVYLLIRCSPLLEQSDLALAIIMITGAVTAFFAASVGLFQNDIKKVIAYSTMSQLGMMVIAVGLSQFNIALAHLVLHAMYKAGLFLAAGSVLHALGDQQDFRRFGGLVKILPVTYTVMLIASLSLAALPWLSGYYSKDLIIELAYGSYTSLGYLVYLLATIAACFTMLYSVKLLYLTFLTYANAPKGNYEKAHESPWVMTLPLIILGVLSVYLGNITRDYFMGLGSQGFGNSIYIHPNHIILIDTEFGVPTINKLLPLILSMLFAILALYLFEKKPLWLLRFNTSNIGQNIYRFFNQRYWFELIYNRCIVKGTLYIGYVTNTILDRGAFELIGPRGAVAGLYKISNYFSSFDSGSIARYAFVMFSGLLFMLFTWIMFANSESIIVDSYSSNYSHGISLSMYQSNYIIFIGMSYINCINNIIYYLLNWKNNPDEYNIPNPYILLSGRSDVPSGHGNSSGFGQGGFNSNTGGSNSGGDDDNNNNNKKRKHEEENGDQEIGTSKDKGKGKAVDDGNDYDDNFITSKDKGTGKAVNHGNDYNDDYLKAQREQADREYALTLQRYFDENHDRNRDESTSRDSQVEQNVASSKDKGKGKAVDQDYGTNYDDYKRWDGSSSNPDLYQPSTSKSIRNNNGDPYQPSSSKTIEKKDPDTYQPSLSKSIENKDPVPDTNYSYPPSDEENSYDDRPSPTASEADRYLNDIDEINFNLAIQRSIDEAVKSHENTYNTSSNDIEKKEESLPSSNNGEGSSSNSNSENGKGLSSNSNTKNNGDNVSKEVSESINKSESDNKLDVIPKSSSSSSNEAKANPANKNIEEKIINFDNNSKGSSETWFDDSSLKILFENPIVDTLMNFINNIPEGMLIKIVNIISSIFG